MLPFVSRRRHDESLDNLRVELWALNERTLKQARTRDRAVIAELFNQKAMLSAQVTTYARTLSAQDDTVRLHLARIEFLQRSLTDATTTTESWAEDRKEALDRIAELEREEKMLRESNDFLRTRCDGLGKALGESRARYGDLEARLAPADAENVGLVQARIRRLIEVLWASRRVQQERVRRARRQNSVPLSAFDNPLNAALAIERALSGEPS